MRGWRDYDGLLKTTEGKSQMPFTEDDDFNDPASHGCGQCEACLFARTQLLIGAARDAMRNPKRADRILCEALDTLNDLANLIYEGEDEDGIEAEDFDLSTMPVAGQA
jgi:hypothetical protein